MCILLVEICNWNEIIAQIRQTDYIKEYLRRKRVKMTEKNL